LAEGDRVVCEVAAAVGLAEGEAGVRAVIAALVRLEPVSIRRIARAVALPVPIVAAVCGELRRRCVVAEERPAQLTTRGRELFSSGVLRFRDSAICGACQGRGVAVPGELAGVGRELARATRGVPAVRPELDQCHCTFDTKLRRVLAMHDSDALVGRRILLLGDDDLTSLAILGVVRRFGSAATIAELAVVDVDPALVGFVRDELAGAPFPVSCLEHDARRPLPASLASRFDTVVTDPPYSVEAARLFLSRAAVAVAGPGASVFFSFGSRRPRAALQVQQAIVEMGFVTRRLARDFNEYIGAGILGGTSHLYELEATGEMRPAVAGIWRGSLYTADVTQAR